MTWKQEARAAGVYRQEPDTHSQQPVAAILLARIVSGQIESKHLAIVGASKREREAMLR